MLFILLFLLSLSLLICITWIPYRLVKHSKLRVRFAVRTWAILFICQIFYLTLIRHQFRVYPFSLIRRNGFRLLIEMIGDFKWVFGQIIHGKGSDYLLIIVLPLIPTLAAFLVGYLLERYYNGNKSN